MIVDQHPADGGEADDHGDRDRPCADADVAGGFRSASFSAISRLRVLFWLSASLIACPCTSTLPVQASIPKLAQVRAVVDGGRPISSLPLA
jgi:hypothetical protein